MRARLKILYPQGKRGLTSLGLSSTARSKRKRSTAKERRTKEKFPGATVRKIIELPSE